MEQLGTLWKYQELDLLMDQYILEKKNSELRQQLLKIKNYLVKQERSLVSMDSDATNKNQLLNKLQQEFNSIEERIKVQMEKLESEEVDSLDEIDELMKEGFQLRDRIRKKEVELKRLDKELQTFVNKIQDIRQRVAKAKEEYIAVKKDYDVEVAGINQELNKLKGQRDKMGSSINRELMMKYKNIKASRTPVMSPLIGNQCAGCNMSLASLMIQRVKDAERIVECENCGRILFDKESITG
jgi:predicted  nucleic acid-binding Zn-ribbon protein